MAILSNFASDSVFSTLYVASFEISVLKAVTVSNHGFQAVAMQAIILLSRCNKTINVANFATVKYGHHIESHAELHTAHPCADLRYS